MPENLIINGCPSFDYDVIIPGDKSITHRAIILASMCKEVVTIFNPLLSDDCLSTISVMRDLGVKIDINDKTLIIEGKGTGKFLCPGKSLNAGNSGTLIRLISGVLAVQDFESEISGDSSLVLRPMNRISDPLNKIGSKVVTNNGKPPIKFKVAKNVQSFNYENILASAQVKSCMILAAMHLDGDSKITELTSTRDHTERLLSYLEYPIKSTNQVVIISGKGELKSKDINIPADMSSAAFFIVASLLKENSKLHMPNVNFNNHRIGIIKVLKKMGAQIEIENERSQCNEPIADITSYSSQLSPVKIDGEIISSLIDELPILFVACALCDGVSEINDIEELRYKESDRIKAMEDGLNILGVKTSSSNSSLKIYGGSIKGGIVDCQGDHRVAMAFSIAALVTNKPITILNTENISTSFPNFVDTLSNIGAEIYES
tara:strand:- start:78940 stop:80238 length:1299 start_codon:yes stop_codon:yes gene_type:complete